MRTNIWRDFEVSETRLREIDTPDKVEDIIGLVDKVALIGDS